MITHIFIKNKVLRLLLLASILFFAYPSGICSQDVRKLKLSNLSATNNSGNVVNQITPGYGLKLRFTAAWDGFFMDRVRMQVTIGERLVFDEALEFRDRMGKFQTDFVKEIILPKDLPEGKQQLTLSMLLSDSDKTGRTKLVLQCEPISITIQVGKGSGIAERSTQSLENEQVSENSQILKDDIILLGEDVGADNIRLHISTLNQKNWFGEVWLDKITASGGRTAFRNYLFQQPAINGRNYDMFYQFVVLKGTVYFDRSFGRIGTSEDAVAYIDEFIQFDSPADRTHTRTLVLKANKLYNQTDLNILVHNYFYTGLTIPKSGIKSSFEVITPSSGGSVRGTIYEVNVKPDGTTTYYLYKGSLQVRNETGYVVMFPGSSITIASPYSPIKVATFSTTDRFQSAWSGITLSVNLSHIPKISPLFVNVVAGGSLVNPPEANLSTSSSPSGTRSNAKNTSSGIRYSENRPFKSYLSDINNAGSGNTTSGNVTSGSTGVGNLTSQKVATGKAAGKSDAGAQNCLGKLKPQFQVPIHSNPSGKEQQARFKMLLDHNKMEQAWFKEAEVNFKKGIFPKELTGTYRPDPNGQPGTGKYWSQTVTLFKEMTIDKVDGFAAGFRLVQGDTDMEIHFSPVSQASGHVLKCGSYKIYVDPDERYEKVWVTVTLKE